MIAKKSSVLKIARAVPGQERQKGELMFTIYPFIVALALEPEKQSSTAWIRKKICIVWAIKAWWR